MSLNMKSYLMVGVAAVGLAFLPTQANAQTTVDVNITTDAGITVTDGVDMEFGTWFLVFRNADPFELRMAADTGVITTVNMAGGAADSLAAPLLGPTNNATMNVQLPVGANNVQLNMTRTAITDFTDPGLTFTNVTYSTATQNAAGGVAFGFPAAVPATIVTGGVNELIEFGGDIQVTATPADASDTATFDVNFNY